MNLIVVKKEIVTFLLVMVTCVFVNVNSAAAATGYAGAWYGDSATNTTTYTNSDGTLGVIKDPDGNTMTNKPAGTGNPPSPTTGFYSFASSSETNKSFVISPIRTGASKSKITFIKYKKTSDDSWSTVPTSDYTSTADYSLSLRIIRTNDGSASGRNLLYLGRI